MKKIHLLLSIQKLSRDILDMKEDFKTCFLLSKEYYQEREAIRESINKLKVLTKEYQTI